MILTCRLKHKARILDTIAILDVFFVPIPHIVLYLYCSTWNHYFSGLTLPTLSLNVQTTSQLSHVVYFLHIHNLHWSRPLNCTNSVITKWWAFMQYRVIFHLIFIFYSGMQFFCILQYLERNWSIFTNIKGATVWPLCNFKTIAFQPIDENMHWSCTIILTRILKTLKKYTSFTANSTIHKFLYSFKFIFFRLWNVFSTNF